MLPFTKNGGRRPVIWREKNALYANDRGAVQGSCAENVIYALRLVWQTDKRLLIGYLLQEGLYAVFSRYLQNILFLKILLDVITGSGDFRTYVGELAAFALLALVVKVAQWEVCAWRSALPSGC